MAVDPIALTRELVNIESTTYNEGRVGEFVAGLLERQGYVVERMPVLQGGPVSGGARPGERFNVVATMAGVTPELVLSTHMDTVPPFFASREDDDFLYGRGTCDAKGILAAQVAAAERLVAQGLPVGCCLWWGRSATRRVRRRRIGIRAAHGF